MFMMKTSIAHFIRQQKQFSIRYMSRFSHWPIRRRQNNRTDKSL